MILLINKPITLSISKDITETLEEMVVSYKIENDCIIVREQKCTLTEYSMNKLFDEVFYEQQISYANLGGAGWDFSISID